MPSTGNNCKHYKFASAGKDDWAEWPVLPSACVAAVLSAPTVFCKTARAIINTTAILSPLYVELLKMAEVDNPNGSTPTGTSLQPFAGGWGLLMLNGTSLQAFVPPCPADHHEQAAYSISTSKVTAHSSTAGPTHSPSAPQLLSCMTWCTDCRCSCQLHKWCC